MTQASDSPLQLSASPAVEAQPTAEERAILRTVLYADVFEYPLTAEEISHWLIGAQLAPAQVVECLAGSDWLAQRVERVNGYVAARGRSAHVVPLRELRRRVAQRLWPPARRYVRLLAHLPFVRMVAITGALALDNVDEGADIDLLIVTAPARVWLVRALTIAVVRLARLERVALCPNYVLAESALALQRRNLYVAHEIVQMAPLAGRRLYERMRAQNAWSAQYVPNAAHPWREERELAPGAGGRLMQSAFERLLGGGLGERLETWERERKLRKFAAQLHQPGANAVLDATQVKGHFQDYGGPVLAEYAARLRAFGLADDGATE